MKKVFETEWKKYFSFCIQNLNEKSILAIFLLFLTLAMATNCPGWQWVHCNEETMNCSFSIQNLNEKSMYVFLFNLFKFFHSKPKSKKYYSFFIQFINEKSIWVFLFSLFKFFHSGSEWTNRNSFYIKKYHLINT